MKPHYLGIKYLGTLSYVPYSVHSTDTQHLCVTLAAEYKERALNLTQIYERIPTLPLLTPLR